MMGLCFAQQLVTVEGVFFGEQVVTANVGVVVCL